MKSPSPSAPWVALAEAELTPSLCGNKARQLGELARAGLPTADGWVLDVDATARVRRRPALALSWARRLMQQRPDCLRWILRSSSPLEDRPGSSGAGLLRSESAAAVPEEIAAALLAVLDSSDNPAVRSLMLARTDRSTRIPVAILAQPHLELQTWLSAEFSSTDSAVLLEGWHHGGAAHQARQSESFELLLTDDGHGNVESGHDPGLDREGLLRVLAGCRAQAGSGSWLVELGATGDGWIVLQLRPGPRRAAPRRVEAELSSARADALKIAGFGLIHASDHAETWVWDVEHCPTPLCPLLAGLFGRWLARQPASWPSRIIQGRWHDRASESDSAAHRRPQDIEPAIRAEFADWITAKPVELEQRLRELDRRLEALERARSSARIHTRWNDFVERWLEFQELYFDGRSSRLRRWVAEVERELQRNHPSRDLPPLPPTETSRRALRWEELAQALRRHPARPTAHADAIAQWVEDHRDEPLARRILESLAENGHLSVLPYDGRSATLAEDPLPLWRELAQRMNRPPSIEPHEAVDHGERRRGRPDPTPVEPALDRATLLASRILARCEDDNELLLRAYAQMRRAVRSIAEHLARRIGGIADSLSVLDLAPEDLESLLEQPERGRFERALRRGQALARHWDSWSPRGRVAEHSDGRLGRAASPGRAQGRPRRLRAALEAGGPAAGEILIVPTIVPTDAVIFSRLTGLVCEGGDVLGHASVLAREHGVPAVVGLRDARNWLADAAEILVDGDHGRVAVLRREGEVATCSDPDEAER